MKPLTSRSLIAKSFGMSSRWLIKLIHDVAKPGKWLGWTVLMDWLPGRAVSNGSTILRYLVHT